MEDLEVRPGDIVAGKYRVEKVLGAGGMGVVVSAKHVTLDSLVAIKLMQPRAVAVKGAVERFMREGQAAARLHSKHVTKVIDVGQLDSGAPYMIMEHLQGGDLAVVLERKGAVPVADAAEYLLQACDAIGEAHAKGIVHRDLKPANLFLQTEPDGTPLIKVLDFGIAKVSGSDQGLTGTSQGMGSGGYMSPEQMSSAKKVDHRADIWALGVTLYELITAHRPFEADSLEQFVTRVFWEQPTPLSAHRPDLPRELEAIILRCLEKQPDARFSSVAHFAHLLAPYAHPRAHPYVGRIAKMLGMDAPALSQTNPGIAPAAASEAAPTAFGPAPAVAVAAPNPAMRTPTPGSHPAAPSAPTLPPDWPSRADSPVRRTAPHAHPGAQTALTRAHRLALTRARRLALTPAPELALTRARADWPSPRRPDWPSPGHTDSPLRRRLAHPGRAQSGPHPLAASASALPRVGRRPPAADGPRLHRPRRFDDPPVRLPPPRRISPAPV
ncbi:MAG: protein kinase [Polyangiaceae bacterium]